MENNETIDIKTALAVLYLCHDKLSRFQYQTLRGQVLAGDIYGALRGLATITERRKHCRNEDHARPAAVHSDRKQSEN